MRHLPGYKWERDDPPTDAREVAAGGTSNALNGSLVVRRATRMHFSYMPHEASPT